MSLQSVAQLGKYWLVNLFQSGGSNVYKLDSKNLDGSTTIFQGDPTLFFGSNAIPVSIASSSGITVPASLIGKILNHFFLIYFNLNLFHCFQMVAI